MKRGTVIALVILVALVGLYVITREEPQTTVRSPLKLEKIEGLSRIEITPPSGGEDSTSNSDQTGGDAQTSETAESPSTTIVFEKNDEGTWRMTRPVESPLSDDALETIDTSLTQTIQTDDIPLSSDKASEYKLDDAQGVRVSLYGEDSESPVHEIVVGKQMSVDNTDAKRTYIRPADSENIYRARLAIGNFVRQDVEEFRSKTILDLDKKAISRLTFEHRDGPTIVLNKKGDKKDASWTITKPEVDFGLDSGEVESIVGALASLNASGFSPDASPSELGLEPPTLTITVSTGDDTTHTLRVGRTEGGEEAQYHVQIPERPFRYKVSSYTGKKLDAHLNDLRSKTPRTFDQKAITRVEFAGDPRIVATKSDDGSWSLVRPSSDKSLNASKLESRLQTLAELRVKDFPDISPQEAGLARGARKVAAQTEDNTYVVLIGDTVEGGDDRYIKFGDRSEIFTISKYTANQLMPSIDDVTGESSPSGPGKGLKGMGKGMGGMKKMRMMKKLKQRMRQRQRGQ